MHSVAIYTEGDLLGDALIKLPAIRGLRAAFPGSRLVWIAGKGASVFASMLKPLVDGYLDEIVQCAGVGVSFRAEIGRAPLSGAFHDVLIDTQTNLATSLLVRRIAHGVFVTRAGHYRLSDRRPRGPVAARASAAGRLSELVALVTGRPLVFDHRYTLPEELRATAAALLPEGPRYVGFGPGAADSRRSWPAERMLEVARRQAGLGRTPVFLLGPAERESWPRIHAAVPAALFPEGMPGLPRGPLLALALIERLAAAVVVDSGIAHLVATGGCPHVAIFSYHDPEKFFVGNCRRAVVEARDYGGPDPANVPVAAVAAALDGLFAVP